MLDKTQYADSVKYVMYHAAWEATSSGFEAPDTIRTIDTVTITYRYADYAFLDSLEMTLLQANNFGYSDFSNRILFIGVELIKKYLIGLIMMQAKIV